MRVIAFLSEPTRKLNGAPDRFYGFVTTEKAREELLFEPEVFVNNAVPGLVYPEHFVVQALVVSKQRSASQCEWDTVEELLEAPLPQEQVEQFLSPLRAAFRGSAGWKVEGQTPVATGPER